MMASNANLSVVELPVRIGIRLVALQRLDEALAARNRLTRDRDDSALHDFRVALRRLRSGLRTYERWFADTVGKADRRKLRDLARSTGEARDIEVQLAWLDAAELPDGPAAGATMLRERLEKAKKPADRAALRSAHRFPALAEHLRGRLQRYTGEIDTSRPFATVTTGVVTAKLARKLFANLDRHFEQLRSDDDVAVAHRARIAAKRLRYLVEPFGGSVAFTDDVVRTLESMQDDLGEMHDMDVLIEGAEKLNRDIGERDASAVAAFAAHLRATRKDLLVRVRAHHAGHPAAGLGHQIERLATELESAGDTADFEIERKFLLNGLPRRRNGRTVVRIDQGWLPGDRIVERVRRVRGPDTTKYLRTIKFGRGLVRREVEDEIDEAMFRQLWPLTRGLRISKRRYSFRDGDRVWTVDRFIDRDLILAEIELESPDDEVEPPPWLKRYVEREVTGLAGYLNVHLAELVGAVPRRA